MARFDFVQQFCEPIVEQILDASRFYLKRLIVMDLRLLQLTKRFEQRRGCVAEQFFQRVAVDVDADIRRVIKKLKSFSHPSIVPTLPCVPQPVCRISLVVSDGGLPVPRPRSGSVCPQSAARSEEHTS